MDIDRSLHYATPNIPCTSLLLFLHSLTPIFIYYRHTYSTLRHTYPYLQSSLLFYTPSHIPSSTLRHTYFFFTIRHTYFFFTIRHTCEGRCLLHKSSFKIIVSQRIPAFAGMTTNKSFLFE